MRPAARKAGPDGGKDPKNVFGYASVNLTKFVRVIWMIGLKERTA